MHFFVVLLSVFIGICLFIYSGLLLTENIVDDYTYILYWIAYSIVGITISVIIALIFIWGNIYSKAGPSGPRGPRGDTGKPGIQGQCADDTAMLGIMFNIRESIQALLTADKIVSDNGKLINNYMERKLYDMVTSKQVELLLDGNSTVGKSIVDITKYLTNIWITWVRDMPGAVSFFTNPDALPDMTPELKQFFDAEIYKYDIWYWGSSPGFRPLKAIVNRQSVIYDKTNNTHIPNLDFPQPDKPPLEFIEIEYSDKNVAGLVLLYKPENTTSGKSPCFYIPKAVTQTNKTYYPLGLVCIEGNNKLKTDTVKKTLLVSGDVIVPTDLSVIWSADNCIIVKTASAIAEYVCLGDYIFNEKQLDSVPVGTGATSPGFNKKSLDSGSGSPATVILAKLNYVDGQLTGDYKGIVAVPKQCTNKLKTAQLPIWELDDTTSIYESENPTESYNIVRTGIDNHSLILDKCTATFEKIPVKALEKKFNDLGMGWFGFPAKKDEKYSIFSYLGIMAEGILTHRTTDMKYYFRHYGGNEPNKYLIVRWDNMHGDYLKTFEAETSTSVIDSTIKPGTKAQYWQIEKDPQTKLYFRLVSAIYPGKYLQLEKTNATTITAKLTSVKGDISAGNKTLFYNTPAYGGA